MTIEDFKNKFRKNKRFDKYWYHGLCYLMILGGLFMLYALWTNSIVKFANKSFPHAIVFIFLIIFGVYGLIVLQKKFKLTDWINELTKEQNIDLLKFAIAELTKTTIEQSDNYVYFIYKKSWWRMPYEVHLFADNNLILISVEGLDTYDGGFIDFGASNRTRNKILKIIKDKSKEIK